MRKLKEYFKNLFFNLAVSLKRFPVTLVALAVITVLNCWLIEDSALSDRRLLMRLIYAGIFTVFVSVFLQFLCERSQSACKRRALLTAASIVAGVSYFFLMTSENINGAAMTIRLFVICFALFAAYLYIPSSKTAEDFNNVALVHFKAAFTAALYGIILYLGCLAIYFAIDLLLVELNSNLPLHLAAIVFIFFSPLVYLSLLPHFNSEDETDIARYREYSNYPHVLDILISYIAIPLIGIYTAVVAAYFVKILVTAEWPIGQIGPMILIYSMAGWFIYVLCGKLTNRFALLYRKYFPFAEIALVCLQLVSVAIRLNAYGITESRYYVSLFGIFSIVCALYLIISKNKKSGMIALLAACFALFSIIPPVDAFSVSRMSQMARIEDILVRNGMLLNDQIIPNADIKADDKREITSIIYYMADMGHLSSVSWMPQEFSDDDIYSEFDTVFGFYPYYGGYEGEEIQYVNAYLDVATPLTIAGYDALIKFTFSGDIEAPYTQAPFFEINGITYTLNQIPSEKKEVILSVSDNNGTAVMEIPLMHLVEQIPQSGEGKNSLPQEKMMLDMQNSLMNVRVIIENINFEISADGTYQHINGNAYVLIAKP